MRQGIRIPLGLLVTTVLVPMGVSGNSIRTNYTAGFVAARQRGNTLILTLVGFRWDTSTCTAPRHPEDSFSLPKCNIQSLDQVLT